jgi:prepilin-type N-terminal cleavage/methylation domain-containing protein
MIALIALMRRRMADESGFTIIELMAALAIFSLAAASLLAVLVAGIQTAGIARDRTVAKDLARQRLEEMRRLPFFQSYSTFPRKTDLLDTYFPDLASPRYQTTPDADLCGTAATCPRYTVTENPVAGFSRYRMEIVTRFIDEDLAPETPASGYRWDSASADRPPTRLLAVDIRVFWGTANPKSFVLRSQLGEALLEDVVLQGSATGTVVRVDTAYSDSSTLLVEGGKSTSTVFVGRVSSARTETLAASARVTEDGGGVTEIRGAQSVAGSPPDVGPLGSSNSGGSLNHPNASLTGFGASCGSRCVATIGTSTVDNVTSAVTGTPPAASGRLTLRPGEDAEEGGQAGFAATNEIDSSLENYRALVAGQEFVRVRKSSGSLRPAKLETSCAQQTTSTACVASGSMSELRMIPVTLAGLPTSTGGYLVTVRFSELTARATARRLGATGSGLAQVTFCGTLTYWSWNGSGWVSNAVTITNTPATCGAAGTLPDPSSVPLGQSPLDGRALFLSDYVSSWAALTAGTTTLSADQTTAEAVLDGVVRITTAPTRRASGYESSGFLVNVGTLRVQAVDRR